MTRMIANVMVATTNTAMDQKRLIAPITAKAASTTSKRA